MAGGNSIDYNKFSQNVLEEFQTFIRTKFGILVIINQVLYDIYLADQYPDKYLLTDPLFLLNMADFTTNQD
jgi:hypothetical protein